MKNIFLHSWLPHKKLNGLSVTPLSVRVFSHVLKFVIVVAVFLGLAGGILFAAEQPATVPASPDVRVVLNRDYLPAARELIRSARKTLDIIQYEYVDYGAVLTIEKEIRAAMERGVKVKMLLDDGVGATRKNVARLSALGIDAKLDETARYREPGDKTTHAKMILADERSFLVGSTNFSDKSISDNNESNVQVDGGAAGKSMKNYFVQLWANPSREPALELFFSADVDVLYNRHYLPAVRKLFQGAKKRIYVVVYGINIGPPGSGVRSLISDMKQAVARGVDVRVMADRSEGRFAEKTLELSEEARVFLEQNGIPMRFDTPEVITHSKVLVVDDAAVVGGTNWGKGPLNDYNDCNVVTRRPAVVRKLTDVFIRLWEGADRY